MGPRTSWASVILGELLLALLACPAPASAHANLVRAQPGVGAAVLSAPTELRLWFSEPPEIRSSTIEVYDADRRHYDQGPVHPLPDDKQGLAIGVRELPEGTYTVAWEVTSAADGHTTRGSFAFTVGATPPPPSAAASVTEFARPTPAAIVTKWLALLAATACVGALGLWALVWSPLLRQAGAPDGEHGACTSRIGRRLTLLMGAAIVILAVATVVALLLQTGRATGGSFASALMAALAHDAHNQTRAGSIASARLWLVVGLALLLGPFAIAALRGSEAPLPLTPTFLGLGLGASYLLTFSLLSHGAASLLWPAFSIALDWLHLLATAVWVGGLLGLVLTAPLLRRLGDAAGARLVLRGVVSRFSTLALLSVAVLGVTGLYSAWLHVGSLDAILPTAYGRTLAVKLALFAGLLALGAFNLLWVRP